MKNKFPKLPRSNTVEVFVLVTGELYTIHWSDKTPVHVVNICRQIVTDCGGEYLGVL